MSRDVRPPVKMRQGTRVLSRVSTEDSDIPSSSKMKHEPAIKRLQGNPTLFLDRESQYPLHLRQHNHGPSRIPIAQGRLLLRFLWKVGLLLHRIKGISFLFETIRVELSFPRVPVLKLVFLES